MKSIIEIENISKQYRLGLIGSGTIQHDLIRWWDKVRGKENRFLKIGETNVRRTKGDSEYVWALRDISFKVQPGEVLGIVGRNGAGKSTLLKILSRVTEPSTGRIEMRGRVASLLEVGTGMHPDLTGRENIFLNGAILGMNRKEIDRKLDEIIDFAGVERYIDTPVKRYSSGMHVRLGFAVAAHLEPEILIVDEVLAVGDFEFQKKCLGKMQDVSSKDGRTILFVSHQMDAVKSLCSGGLILADGCVEFASGNIDQLVAHYLDTRKSEIETLPINLRRDIDGDGSIILEDLTLIDSKENKYLILGKPISIQLTYSSNYSYFLGRVVISINTFEGQKLVFADSDSIISFPKLLPKNGIVSVTLSNEFALPQGRYFINVAFLVDGRIAAHVQQALTFEVLEGVFYETGKQPLGTSLCYVKQDWQFNSY